MTSADTGDRGALDPEAIRSLVELVGEDPAALAEIIDAFLEEAPERLAELRRGAIGGDHVLAGRAAHTLKANGRTFGAGNLAGLCQEIELAARAGDLGPALAHLDEVDARWLEVRQRLVTLREGAA